MIHRFAGCELDEERRELRRRGRAVKLEPKVFDVLVHLLRHPERVVTKAELLDGASARSRPSVERCCASPRCSARASTPPRSPRSSTSRTSACSSC